MKITKRIIAFCIASIMAFVFVGNISLYATAPAPGQTLRVLLMYDESYEYFMEKRAGITSNEEIEDMLLSMTRLLQIPYNKTLNINFIFTVMKYENIFGQTYASVYGNNCLWNWVHTRDSNTEVYKQWHSNCWTSYCVGHYPCAHGSVCYAPYITEFGHPSSGTRYLREMTNYLGSANNPGYDICALYVGHAFCSVYNNEHDLRGGLAMLGGRALIMRGCDGLLYGNTNLSPHEKAVNNIINMMGGFEHEFAHILGIDEGVSHSANQPCCLRTGFDGVVYVENLWCDICLERLGVAPTH